MPTLKEQFGSQIGLQPTLKEQFGDTIGLQPEQPKSLKQNFQNVLGIFPERESIDPSAGVDLIRSEPEPIVQTEPSPFLPKELQQKAPDRPFATGTEQTLKDIDELFGVPRKPSIDPRISLTPAEQKFEQQSGIGKVASTAGRTLARAGIGAVAFIPNLVEKLIIGDEDHKLNESKPVGELQAFVNTLPKPAQIIIDELKGILDLVGDVPAQLDFALQRAIGRSDPTKGINPDNPLVRAYEGITGKPFIDYYNQAVDNLFEAPESLAFGLGLGKGIGKGITKKAVLKPTLKEQFKDVIPETFEKTEAFEQIPKRPGAIGEVRPIPEKVPLKPKKPTAQVSPTEIVPKTEKFSILKKGEKEDIPVGQFKKDAQPVEFKDKTITEVKATQFYHGTAEKFEKFDIRKSGTVQYSDWGDGIYLTKDKISADSYRVEALKKKDIKREELFNKYESLTKEMKSASKDKKSIISKERDLVLKEFQEHSALLTKRLSKDKSIGDIINVELSRDAKIMEHNPPPRSPGNPTLSKTAKERGFDAILIDKGKASEEVLVINPDIIIRKDIKPKLPDGKAKVPTPEVKPLVEPSKPVKPTVKPEVKAPSIKPKAPIKPPKPPLVKAKPPTERLQEVPIKDVVQLNKRANQAFITEFNLNEIDPVKREQFRKSVDRATQEKSSETAIDLGKELQKNPRAITREEHIGMVQKKAQLEGKVRDFFELEEELLDRGDRGAAANIRGKREVALQNIEDIVRGNDKAGTELARDFNIRKIGLDPETHDVVGTVRRAKAAKQRLLTPEQETKFKELGKRDEVLTKEVDRLTKLHDENVTRIAKLEAEKKTKQISQKEKLRTKTAKTIEKIREARKDDIRKLNEIGFRTSAGLDPQAAFLIGRIAVSYMKEGAVSLKEVVRKVLIDLPDLTESDVIRSINAKDTKLQRKQRSRSKTFERRLKTQARLITEVEDAANGIFRTPKKKTQQIEEIVVLQKTLRKLKADNKAKIDKLSGATAKRLKSKAENLELRKLNQSIKIIESLENQLEKNFRLIKKQKVEDSPVLTQNRKKISELRKQIKQFDLTEDLKKQIREAEEGKFRDVRKQPIQPEEIRSLQQQLRKLRNNAFSAGHEKARLETLIKRAADLEDQLANFFRTIKTDKRQPLPEAIKDVQQKIRNLRREIKVEDDIASLQEQLQTGEFIIRDPRPIIDKPLSLQKKEVELIRLRKKKRQEIFKLEPLTTGKVLREVANTLLTFKATLDVSGIGRQGAILTTANPDIGTRAIKKGFRAVVSEFNAELFEKNLREAPTQFLRDRAGLELTELGGKLLAGEEQFMSNFIDKIPAVRDIVRASERNMTTVLNQLRAETFDRFLSRFPDASNATMRAWADFINKASGRGNLGKFNRAGALLSFGFFAPRFAVSRIQTPLTLFKDFKDPVARKAKARALASFGATAVTALALADLSGADVSLDPRTSDFGKIRVGNTRFDIFAGIQQPVRLLTRILFAQSDRAGLTGKELTDIEQEFDITAEIGRFAEFKQSAAASVFVQLTTGKDIFGEEVTPQEIALNAVTPIIVESIAQAFKEEGIASALGVGVSEFFGVGAGTFPESFNATRKKIRRLQAEDNIVEAERVKTLWNINNPDRPIATVKSVDQSNFDSRLNKVIKLFDREEDDKARKKFNKLKEDFPDFKDQTPTEAEIKKEGREKKFNRQLKDIENSLELGLNVADRLVNLKRRFPKYRSFKGFQNKILNVAELKEKLRKRKLAKRKKRLEGK